ncbi:MAG TPA: CBS domain-containing protein [Candidatus Koribacter sp.]|jgi:CBS domain-containing protein/sporulation protein YlmC with PRC-barrel domain
MANYPLSDLIGAPVFDASGAQAGRVRELAIVPQQDANKIASMVLKTKAGQRLLAAKEIVGINGGIQANVKAADFTEFAGSEGMLMLTRDLLDQQIIDTNGRKVVRVNDVELATDNGEPFVLKVTGVDIGARGAARRLLKGVVPRPALNAFLGKLSSKLIPWDYVDLIETDPARRVKLKISGDKLATLHPADLADIIEELAPAEREALFQTLDEDVAAQALEEVDPKLQVSILSSLDTEHAADIVEEMNPDAAADLLAEMPEEHSEEILTEMEPAERQEVEGLMEFEEDTAAGRMTTDYMAMLPTARVAYAIEMMRHFDGPLESMSTIFLVDKDEKLVGSVPLAKLVLANPTAPLADLSHGAHIFCHPDADEREVAEMFDKYNLLTLPVVDDDGVLTGVITADDVISLLRSKL